LHPANTNNFTFTPLLPNGSQSQTFTLTNGPLLVEVGGSLDIKIPATLGEQSISYTIEVNYL
jgi:hypothetical protein